MTLVVGGRQRNNMLEQSNLNGVVYKSVHQGKTLATTKVNITDVKFGKPIEVIIHRNPHTTSTLIEDVATKTGYIYDELGSFVKTVQAVTSPDDICKSYKYGIAEVDGEKHNYLIQNNPPVSIDDLPDLLKFEMLPTMIGYPYSETFTYSDELIHILGDVRATYVDSYKRPLNPYIINSRIFLPIGIDKVTTTFKEVVNKHSHFPIVCELTDTEFAVIDLEPDYTDEDYQIAESYPAIYKETTPRGGIHYLIRTNSKAFKFRHTPKLEIIVNSMVTFYGTGQVINKKAELVTDFHEADEMGKQHIEVAQASQDVKELVDRIQEYSNHEGWLGEEAVRLEYTHNFDLSHADFMASINLYKHNVKPYISNHINTNIQKEDLPWILAEYMSRLIEFRLKHNRTIQGVPYLVYIATKVVNYYT